MRNARLQSQDLLRTNEFISALLSKDDIKNEPKPEATDAPKPHMVNGNGVPFRPDPKPRFSDPPAPPPQQPLPEKPDVSRVGDVPSLKRGTTERPKPHPPNASPIRQDSQIMQLTEALNMAKKEIDTQHAQMRDLEEMLRREQEARKSAEELARKLEDAAAASLRMNGSAKPPGQESILEETFDPPVELIPTQPAEADAAADDGSAKELPQLDHLEASANLFRLRIDSMAAEIKSLKQHLDEYKERAEKAEVERDSQRDTLAEMVRKLRERDEEDTTRAAQRGRSRSQRRRDVAIGPPNETALPPGAGTTAGSPTGDAVDDPAGEQPTLSRANTITPSQGELANVASDPALVQGVPYVSMISVVLIGMGLMAYLNGWQPQRLEQ